MKSLLTSWLSSLGVGAVTAIVGAACGVWIATLAVTWQPTPNRVSGSAYAVYYAGLLAAAAGGIIGLVVSRWCAQAADVPMVRAALTATAIHVALLGVIGSVMRLMSDVPPTFEGEKLLLAVELSWPEAAAPPIPSGDAPPHMALAIAGATSVLDSRPGILFAEDARRERGRYIVPGVVEVWTERKARILSVNTGTLAPMWTSRCHSPGAQALLKRARGANGCRSTAGACGIGSAWSSGTNRRAPRWSGRSPRDADFADRRGLFGECWDVADRAGTSRSPTTAQPCACQGPCMSATTLMAPPRRPTSDRNVRHHRSRCDCAGATPRSWCR
jgi:hypothetical protein